MVRKNNKNLFLKKNNFFFNKKAFGGVVSTLIMFIAVVGVSTGMVIAFQDYISKTQSSFKVQNDITSNKLKSALTISSIIYDSGTSSTLIYVKNIGTVVLAPDNFDLFVDGSFSNTFDKLYADNLSKNMTLFNPQETLAINYSQSLISGTHDIRVVTGYGSFAEGSFNN